MSVVLTCDTCGKQFFFNKWMIATDLWIGSMKQHVRKHIHDQSEGKENSSSKAIEIMAAARKMVDWVKENAKEKGCIKCGSHVIKIAGMDTDTMWLRCNGCGNVTEQDLMNVSKEMEQDETKTGKD